MAVKQLYINGTGTGAYGIYISSDTYLNAPAPDYTAHKVPGRSGALVQWNKRLQNVVRKFDCYIPDSVQANFDAFKKFLYTQVGYMTITSDYESDTYQRGYLAEEIEAAPFQSDGKLVTTFSLYFSCEPQKYFKNNSYVSGFPSSPFAYQSILSRTSPFLQKFFQMLPAGDVPDGDGFLVIGWGSFAALTVLSAVHAWLPSYTGFIATVLGDSLRGQGSASELYELIGYSYEGEIDAPAYSKTLSMPTNVCYVILPIDVKGSLHLAYELNGVSYEDVWTLASQMSDTNSDAVGISYDLTVTGEYGRASDDIYDYYTMFMEGTLGGVPSFSSLIELDTTVFREMSTAGTTYPVEFTIHSDDMSIEAEFNGANVNIYNNVSVQGNMEGMADAVSLYWYHLKQTPGVHTQDPLIFQTFTLTPRWWKV